MEPTTFVKSCENCDCYSFKIRGPDWSEGKCFVDYRSQGKLGWVKSGDVCDRWVEATLYDGDGVAYQALGGRR